VLEVDLVKLPRATKGEERKRKDTEWRKKDTLGSIVVERNAREERASERWAWWWTKTRPDKLRSLDLSLSIEIGLK
jgi:hypothetical protein